MDYHCFILVVVPKFKDNTEVQKMSCFLCKILRNRDFFIRIHHLPQEVFENHSFSLFSSQSWSGTLGINGWINLTREVSFNLPLLSMFKTILSRKTNSFCSLRIASEITWTWKKKLNKEWAIHFLWSAQLFTWLKIFFSPTKKIQQRRVQQDRKHNTLKVWKYCIAL